MNDTPMPALPEHRSGGVVKHVVIVAVALAVIAGLGAWKVAGGTSSWHDSIDEGLVVAHDEQKPVIILFTADWCPPCRLLKKRVLSDAEVMDYLRQEFVLVKVDLTDPRSANNAVAAENDVASIPTVRAYDSDGDHIGTYNGDRTKHDFLAWARRCRG